MRKSYSSLITRHSSLITIFIVIIAQILLDGASEYERKSQRIDAASFEISDNASIAHVYAPKNWQREIDIPYIANTPPKRAPFSFRKRNDPREIVTPFNVPEAVEDAYFRTNTQEPAATIGSFQRKSITPLIEQSMHRIDRFRDDITWRLFTHVPSPDDIASVGVWVDPAVEDDDYDGFVAEAMAGGVMVVAARTPINEQRCEGGRAGFLVPRNDPNEMTHAILTALFKPEAARARSEASRQTVAKYRSRHRARALALLYEKLS